MQNRITDEVLENVGILAKLDLTDENREAFRHDLAEMLAYVDKLNEVDTEGITLSASLQGQENVFREDIVMNENMRDEILKNAPDQKNGMCLLFRKYSE